MRLLVSACLLGLCCRYDGGSKPCPAVIAFADKNEIVPVCPEQLGGLPTPRPPAEIQKNGRVMNREGQDVTAAYEKGAEEALRLCRMLHCEGAVLKARSPSCGCENVYDGSFSGVLIPGQGIAAQRLAAAGIPLWSEENLPILEE
ncbi:MAG: DUF523 domain-containing protein [Clostridia bacterium]|nr:DUF523 domain-containing protein [Clostridia bacterium]